MKYSYKFPFIFCAVLLTIGCQKVDPKVMDFANDESASTESDPQKGRITLGSDSEPQVSANGAYKLKGRISLMDPINATSVLDGRYKLSGTVRF